jgi:hypothetical protein
MQAITTMQWVSTFEEQAVRKPLYSRPPQLVMHGLKAQGTLCGIVNLSWPWTAVRAKWTRSQSVVCETDQTRADVPVT